ncbi:hypothetical protein AB5I41_10215 [Sphingomonas sp. MMS24-JH45]
MPDAVVELGLIYGHATPHNAAQLVTLFEQNRWILCGPAWLRQQCSNYREEELQNGCLLRSSPSCCCDQGSRGVSDPLPPAAMCRTEGRGGRTAVAGSA